MGGKLSQNRGFYVTVFLDELHAGVARYGPRALKVRVDPRAELDERDVALLA